MSLDMRSPFMETARRRVVLHSFLSLFALMLPGCSVGIGSWWSRTPAIETPSAPPSAPTATTKESWLPSFSLHKAESDENPQYVTEEDLLKIVTELQRVSGKDTYRFSIPKDVTGANVDK